MPATITHAYFGRDLFNKLPKDIKNIINNQKKSMMMFAQSMDALMFYNVYNPFPGKKIRTFSSTFHNNKTDEFFSNLITYMKNNNYYSDPKSLAFLYGLIAHFCLDSTTHPYIFYKTGEFRKEDKDTFKYNGYHSYMESYIDNYYLKKFDNTNKVNFNSFCFDFEPFSEALNNCIDYSFNKTFNIKNMSKKYYKSLKQMKNFIILFRFDYTGIKRNCYTLIDTITPKQLFRFKSLSYNLNNYENYDFLNIKKKKWCYPVDKEKTSTKSFPDLYNDALKEAQKIIKEINLYFFKDKDINVKKLFNNKSYVTGIDCNNKKKQTFFEF